ncbi:IclR family transcriptional regulator [Paraburkholderia adhaesiva]|uniref:IclR family transcriptional regulator n=1 Tax=Paraburkholderia adhaesiva TaxID=2883244 RepID=UPI001F26C1C3|nr:IclR family transcriptional regulator [Paraburkholderia adhaesiva]
MRLLQSLTRGLDALTYLRTNRGPVRLTEIASVLGVDKSIAAHLLKTLVASGYAKQDQSRRYLVSNGKSSGEPVQRTLEEVVAVKENWRPALERIAASTGECTHLAVLVGQRVWYIDKVDSTLPLKVDHPIGSLSPLHCTALGKAFLAFGHAEMPSDLVAHTSHTLTSARALAEDLERTRERGYAIDDEEFTDGIRCVARPVYDEHGEMIATAGISCPSVRVDATRLAELGGIILRESVN